MLAISLRPRIPRNPKQLLAETSLGYEYMKQGKYISEDERGGQGEFAPFGRKIKTYS
jgi:hypothetical protein